MKKSFAALAAVAVACSASAQSSVRLFGVLDAAVNYSSNESYADRSGNTVKAASTTMRTGGYNTSRLGFRGTEDLGGGLSAGFWLETTLRNDTGAAGGGGNQLFNRRATVSLAGGFGEIRLGRDYVPTYWNDIVFDAFGIVGAGRNPNAIGEGGTLIGQALGIAGNDNYDRANNSISYYLPKLGGFYGQVMYGLPERIEYDPASATPTTSALSFDARYAGGRFGYANGPLDIAIAYGENVVSRNFQAGGRAKTKIGNFGASWDFGYMKLMGEYNQTDVDSNVVTPTAIGLIPVGAPVNINASSKGYLIGARVPVGAGQVRVSYSYTDYDLGNNATDDPETQKFAIGYVHNLSKRTALYTTAAYLKNKNTDAGAARGLSMTVGGPTAGLGGVEKSMGYEAGIRHSF